MTVTVTDQEIVHTSPKGEVRRVSWSSLIRVALRTTDDGPFGPDMFWYFFAGGDKPALFVPCDTEGEQDLLPALQERLPGFNNDLFIEAMSTVTNRVFLLWEAEATPVS